MGSMEKGGKEGAKHALPPPKFWPRLWIFPGLNNRFLHIGSLWGPFCRLEILPITASVPEGNLCHLRKPFSWFSLSTHSQCREVHL